MCKRILFLWKFKILKIGLEKQSLVDQFRNQWREVNKEYVREEGPFHLVLYMARSIRVTLLIQK